MPLDVGPHPEDLQLEQYSMGTLPEQAAGPLEEHLLVCELCQDRLLKMDTYVNAMRSVSPRWREESRRRQEVGALRSGLQRLWKAKLPLPLAMAACVLLAALVWVAPRGRERVNAGAPVSVVLRSSRGPEDVLARVPFGKTPVFRLDLTELPAHDHYRLEVVNARGRQMWESNVIPSGGQIQQAAFAALPRGAYFVRLYTPENELLREFSLTVE